MRLILNNADDKAIQRIKDEFLDMQHKIEQGERDPQVLTQCDLNFHHALGQATGNELLGTIYDFILEYFAPSIEKTHVNETSGRAALETHREIIDALSSKDIEQAMQAIEDSVEVWVDLSV